MTRTAQILVVLGGLLLPQVAHAAPALIACMTAHKNEMKELNTQIADLQRMKVAPGGPKVKQGDCAHRLKAIHGSALPVTTDKNSADHAEKISCLTVKKTLLEQHCICEAKGLQFADDPAVIDKSLAAYERFTDARKAARRVAKDSPELKKLSADAEKTRGCYSAQVIELLTKSSVALEKMAKPAR